MIDLRLGDCLDVMPTLAAQSYDAIIADIPYGTTACKWDTVIPFDPMWAELKRLAKPKAAIVLFGSQPFTSALVASNFEMFKYCLYWKKERGTGFARSGYQPMRQVEDVCVFSSAASTFAKHGIFMNYYPQLEPLDREYSHALPINKSNSDPICANNETQGRRKYKTYTHRHPTNLIEFPRDYPKPHPTQKPVALMEYLIRTYTNEGDAVLDFTMGSGTTMVACVNTRRNGTGIEKDAGYFAIAERRVKEAQAQLTMVMA